MSIHTKNKCSPQGHHNIAGQDWPFPTKPVFNRRHPNPSTQESLDLYTLKEMTISKPTEDHLSPKEVRGIPGFNYTSKELHELHRKEIEMGRLLDAKKLMLREKLIHFEKKVRQKLQSESVDTNTGHGHKHEEKFQNSTVWPQSTLSEQHRRRGEDLIKERKQEDVEQLMKKQSHRDEDRMRNTQDEENGIWRKVEMEFEESPRSTFKGNKGSHYIAVNRQQVSGELSNLRKQHVKEVTRMQRNKIEYCSGSEGGVRPDHGILKTNGRELNDHFSLTKENKYREIPFTHMYSTDNEHKMPHMTPHKSAHRFSKEIHRNAEGTIFEVSTLPPILNSSYSCGPQQREPGLMESTDASLHLLPCRVCNRKFASGRLEKHIQICKKVNQSHRQVFNSYIHRTKGSAIEEYWKTHSRSITPELFEPNYKTKNLHQGRLQVATSK